MTNILDELQWRGLVAQTTDDAGLRAAFNAGPVTYYTGYDPTAQSLHIGHLVQLLNMRRLQLAGHRPIALVGGATGLIGDPRPTAERAMNTTDTVAEWVERIRVQIAPYLDSEGSNGVILVNNLEWTQELSAIDLLRDIGKHFRLGTMISKDIVARRLASDEGISYSEFSYQILQSYDFRELHRRYGCTLQSAGNDQWGNVVAGIEFARKTDSVGLFGLTSPLITKADGSKMGKSEGGAVWLDPTMVSPYTFYQYWLNTADEDVIHYLKVFTFRTRDEIDALQQEVQDKPFRREAQKALAGDLTALVHGEDALKAVVSAAQALFGRGDLRELDAITVAGAVSELNSVIARPGDEWVDLFVGAGLAGSRGEARRAVADGGAYVNNVKITSPDQVLASSDLLHGRYVVLRRGKKTLAVAEVSA
ncbi:MAG: tyrosine--tRNA ligase [Cellulomonadaceae bacterium]|nr:tyrosine--tRNA ligase [Cellulomonadaceae bacterium]